MVDCGSWRLRGLVSVGLILMLTAAVVRAGEPVEVWGEVEKLRASDASDRFGTSVAISGEAAVVGADGNGDYGPGSGAAYVFERQEGAWGEVQKLLASDGVAVDSFGESVGISGEIVVVGARNHSDNGPRSGAAYVFERDAEGVWVEVQELLASDGASEDEFGRSVAVSGETVVVGAWEHGDNGSRSGAAYVFERDAAGVWSEVRELLASDGASDDFFGWSVAVSGETVVVGALNNDDNDSGSVYVFQRDGDGAWVEVQELLSSDGRRGDDFGKAVAISGETLIVGARLGDDNGGPDVGSAYVFERDAEGVWVEVQELHASDGVSADLFGESVAVSGETVVVGAYFHDPHDGNGVVAGSAYVFERDAAGNWIEVQELLASDGVAWDFFGDSVAVSARTAFVGATEDGDYHPSGSGYAYPFEKVLVDPTLSASGLCPGEVTLTVTGVTPRALVDLVGSNELGRHTLTEGACAGTELDLQDPRPLRRQRTDADQEGTLVLTVPDGWCGRYLQLVDQTTCLTSTAARIPER